MIEWQPYRKAIGLSVVAVALFCLLPVISAMQTSQVRRGQSLDKDVVSRDKALAMLQTNIAAAKDLSKRMSASNVERLLTPVDRLQAVSAIEDQASLSHLQRFTYTLGPEKKPPNIAGEAAQGIVISDLAISADVPNDIDVYSFIAHLRDALPGRLHLQHVFLTRLPPDQAAVTTGNMATTDPVDVLNLHFEAKFDWLSNASANTADSGGSEGGL